MAARKNARLQVQSVAIDNIKIEKNLQSRVTMNKEYVREFSEAILRGDVFPPVDVFWDGREYWLADGFHRAEAHRKAGIIDIRCNVHYGTRRDALIYSAGANHAFTIPRTTEDKKRATFMLLSDEEWLRQSAPVIGAHVGVGKMTIAKWRIEFCQEKGIQIPENVISSDGREFVTSPALGRNPPSVRCYGGEYRTKISGKIHYLGRSEKEAIKKRDAIIQAREEEKDNRVQIEIASHLANRLSALRIYSRGGDKGSHGLGNVRIIAGGILVGVKTESPDDVCFAVGRAILNRAKYLPCGRAIVLCYDPPACAALEIARKIGIEFMTPEELAVDLKKERPVDQ
jgi:hypothetical protein